jgi:hypothetical protein
VAKEVTRPIEQFGHIVAHPGRYAAIVPSYGHYVACAHPRPASSRRAVQPKPLSCPQAANGYMRLSTTASESLLAKNVASFDLVRHHRTNDRVFLYAFDLSAFGGKPENIWSLGAFTGF